MEARAKRAPMERIATHPERFGVKFDIKAFAEDRGVQVSVLGRTLGLEGGNVQNWIRTGYAPLSALKAWVMAFDRERAAFYEQTHINGKIERAAKVPWRMTDKAVDLAREYDAMRQGVRLRMLSGEVIEIPTLKPDLVLVPTLAPAQLEGPAEPVVAAAVADIELVIEHSIEPPPPHIRTRTPAEGGMTAGEREILVNMCLRLNHQLAQEQVEKRRLEIQLDTANERIATQSKRVHELVATNRALDELVHNDIRKHSPTLATITTPHHAEKTDYDSVKKDLAAVPALQRIVDEMYSGFRMGAPVLS